jgi:D-sedoheptulose 7-phosphate isomerase
MFATLFEEHIRVFQSLATLEPVILTAADLFCAALAENRKILVCGNGGSAADAQHFAAELIGRFQLERAAWPAVALTTDSSILTALGNDYGFDRVFARQVEGLGIEGDVLLGLSTSGNSPNIVQAVSAARHQGLKTVLLLGRDGGCLRDMADVALVVPAAVTARIQEAHIFILHVWAQMIETRMIEARP